MEPRTRIRTIAASSGHSLLLAWLALALGACGKAPDPAAPPAPASPPPSPAAAEPSPASSEPAAAAPDYGKCEVDVTGSASARGESKGGLMTIGTEYWLGAADFDALVAHSKDPGFVSEFRAREIKTYLLQLNCGDSNAKIMFGVGNDLTKAQFPMGPGRHKVTAQPKPGEVSVLFGLGTQTPFLDGEGVVEITAWDHQRFVGTFDVPAKNGESRYRYQGRFDLKCHTATCGR